MSCHISARFGDDVLTRSNAAPCTERQSSIKDDGGVSNTLVRGVCYFTNTLNNLGSHAQVFRLCTHWMGDTPCSRKQARDRRQGPRFLLMPQRTT